MSTSNFGTAKRQLHLNTFLYLTGHHDAAWRVDNNRPERRIDIDPSYAKNNNPWKSLMLSA
ncbi:hypothetical protein DB346_07705 [Verrucomicrobia bacterium LW23]|nr:hypothetical protein DB346_07705 [Verrucomicrobia bacterium LW23]